MVYEIYNTKNVNNGRTLIKMINKIFSWNNTFHQAFVIEEFIRDYRRLKTTFNFFNERLCFYNDRVPYFATILWGIHFLMGHAYGGEIFQPLAEKYFIIHQLREINSNS